LTSSKNRAYAKKEPKKHTVLPMNSTQDDSSGNENAEVRFERYRMPGRRGHSGYDSGWRLPIA
jgi:hypothetical protein